MSLEFLELFSKSLPETGKKAEVFFSAPEISVDAPIRIER